MQRAKKKFEQLFKQMMDTASPVQERVREYAGFAVARDVRGFFGAIVKDLDKERIRADVAALRAKHPRMSNAQLAEVLIRDASNAMSGAAMASGLAWVIPVVGIPTGMAASAAEFVAMSVYQSRLVVSIAELYGKDIESKARVRDVIVCVASTSAGTAVQLTITVATRMLAERLAMLVARRSASAVLKSIPVAGAVAGVAGGAAGAVFNRMAVKAVGRYAVRFYGSKPTARRTPRLTGPARKLRA